MAIYTDPNGDRYNIPTDPEKRKRFVQEVKATFGEDVDQTTILGQVGEFVKAIPRGAAGLALDVPTGIVGLFDIGNDSDLYKGLEGLQDKLRQDSILAGDPAYADKFSTKLGEGVGSFGPFLGAGLAGRALAKAPGAAKGLLSPMNTLPAALAVPTGIAAQGDRLQMAREMGEDVSGFAETTAELFGGVIGLTEIAPIAAILGKVSKSTPASTKEYLMSALQSGAYEGGQEVTASILQDLTARGLYSEELPIGESMFEEFTIGGIIGAGADLIVSSMAGKKNGKEAIRNKYMQEDGLRAQESKEQLILSKKAELAAEQGTLEEVQELEVVTVPNIVAPETIEPQPEIEVIMTPQEQFAVVDITNPASPAQIDIKDTEIDAIQVKQKILKDFNGNKLKSKLDNDTYNLGLINSSTAYEIGQSLVDTNAADINIQQLINNVPDKSPTDKKLKKLVKDFEQTTGRPMSSMPRISMTGAKGLLTSKEFNNFASSYATQVFKQSEKNGEPSLTADKDTPTISSSYIRDIAESKNIDFKWNSPAVRYAAKTWTGSPTYQQMNIGQKQLFLSKIHSLPKFNSKIEFPDFRPRDYSAKDMADFIAQMKSNKTEFSKKDLSGNKATNDGQFFDDLVYSNRIEKVEGTNKYKIRDNFEFDIARKAEGFNETPDEFGARLISENKLPQETIDQLIESEKVKQEKLLPPVEIIPKTINYIESIEEGKTNKFAKEIRKTLNARGLKDTGIVISDEILSTTTLAQVDGKIKYDPRQVRATDTQGAAAGEYDRNTDTIFLSLNAVNPDGNATDIEIQQRLNKLLDHEMIHAFRAKDLITEKEYQYLTNLVKKTKFPKQNQTFYKEAEQRTASDRANKPAAMQEEIIVEEAIAELFANKDLLVNTPPKVEGIFNKIIEFFRSMGQAMRSSGYKSSQEIFNDIESGKLGSRERGVVRTTRLGDKERSMFLDRIPTQDEPGRREILGEDITSDLRPAGVRPLTIPKPKPTPPTPPAGPTTPPTIPITSPVPNKIYDSRQMSAKEKSDERTFILNGLKKTGVFNPRSNAKGDSVKMMKWLKDNAPNKDYKIIATKVHQSLISLEKLGYDFPLEITADKNKTRGFRGRVSYTVLPRPTYFEMRINDVFGKDFVELAEGKIGPTNFVARTLMGSNGVNFETLLHEGIHQATIAQMENVSGGAKSNNKKIQKAYKDLASQRKRVETHVRDMMSKFNEGATSIDEGNLTFDEFISSLPTTLNPALRRDLVNVYFSNGNLRTKNEVSNGLRNFEKNFIQYKINGIQSGNSKADSSEFLTFGLTNRNFQELLESIPTKPGATKSIWNEFVETIRNILGLPAKLDTELSAFLKNAGVVLDLQSEGIPIAGDYRPRGIEESQDIPTFSRAYKSKTTKRVAPGLYEYRGFAIEDIGTNYGLPNREWSFGKLEEGMSAKDATSQTGFYQDSTNSLKEAKEFIDRAYFGEDTDIPTFSRTADQAYFEKEKRKQKISNLEAMLEFKEAELQKEYGFMTDGSRKTLEQKIKSIKNKIIALKSSDIPLFSRGQRFNDGSNTQENIQLREALAEAEETVKQTPRGSIPFYNLNASDQALEIALEFNKDLSVKTPEDVPNFSRPTLDGVNPGLVDFIDRTGGVYEPIKSWGARLIEIVKDPITAIRNGFKDFRQNFVDKLDKVDKKLVQASLDNENVRFANNTADTATMAALRMADRARGLFQGMLTRGYVSDVIDGNSGLANVKDLELQNGETGGLIQILAPLFSNPELSLEKIFKAYATLKRAESFDAQNKLIETPVNAEDYAYIQLIEQQHPEVVEVYNNYQTWNNKLIDFAQSKGILDAEQADLWREHSSYYPFYKNMVDDSGIQGPVIAGGALPNNPLSIKIEGSDRPLDVDPIEAISRNSLSILTAALKNDGTAKLLRDLQSIGEARPVTAKQSSKLNTIFVFENGIKQFYEVDDINLFHGIQGIGGVNTGTITKILAIPAGLLRDTVTRDPGFVVINILRDTLSSAVTSGAPMTPVIDSVKNMFRDMQDLEKFGVLGGYDFSNDEGSVKQFITRTMRQQGLSPSNGMSASGAFFKLWDGLGALTTKSDGATRLAVYEGVYKKLKDKGYTEAQAQSEAAFQALEIINFGRRGLDPMFKVITAAIPFLNARVQGLDVLYRSFTGQYSSVEKLQEGETLQDVQSRIMRKAFLNAGLLSSLTLLYYMMVSDTDEYKNLKREVRDDNWVFPIGDGHAVKIPIPFEVGMLFKAIPERIFDMTLGDEAFTKKSANEALTTTSRQLKTSLNIPFFQPGGGLQLLKPISEALNNRNTFTNTEIVPYYQQKKEAGLQSRATTNELARVIGEFLNISPAKLEHVIKGYTGTLGGYVLTAIDTMTRQATGSPLLPSNIELRKIPVINRLLIDLDKSGGYQQQFYELRSEVDKAVQTINSLQKQQRFDELSAYRSNMQGVLNIKGQVRAIERYLKNWRERRDRLMRNENISLTVKSDMLRDLELERDKRLALVPEMRKKAEVPVMNINL